MDYSGVKSYRINRKINGELYDSFIVISKDEEEAKFHFYKIATGEIMMSNKIHGFTDIPKSHLRKLIDDKIMIMFK